MRQWLRLTKESTYATYDGSASAGNIVWPRLTGDNAFVLYPQNEAYEIASYDALAEVVQYDCQRQMLTGSLTTPFYGLQANFFLGLATTLVGTGSPAVYNLGSFTADFYDGVRTRRMLGCQIANAVLTFPTAGPATWTFQIVANKVDATNPTLAEPASTVFPAASHVPFNLSDTSGGLKIGTGNTARTRYSQIVATWANNLVAEQTESKYPTYVYGGRKVSVNAGFHYLSGETDRAAYEGVTAQTTCDLVVTRTGFQTVTLDWKGQGRITGYQNAWKMSGQSSATLDLLSMYDGAAGTSFAFSVVDPV